MQQARFVDVAQVRPDSRRGTVWRTATWRAWDSRSMNVFFKSTLHTALTVRYDLMHVKYLGYVQFTLWERAADLDA